MVDKNTIKFKTKPLEHMDLIQRVYEGTTATGKYAWTPGAAFEHVAIDDGTSPIDEEDFEDNSGLPPFHSVALPEDTVHHTSVPEDDMLVTVNIASSTIHADNTPTSGGSKRKFSCTTHPQRKKEQSEGALLLASCIENLAFSCTTRLYSLEGLDPQDPLIVFGLMVLDNPANQAIMVRILTDATIISWLRMKKSQSMDGPSAANFGMGGWF
ncbi:unnamed protein product [Camellia sinensis]